MILLLIFLSVSLNMSLPEFQPETDLSGNYVIGEFDVSDGEFKVAEAGELPDGLTVEAPSAEIDIYNNSSAEEILHNERALETHTVNASVKSGYRISGGAIAVHSGDNLYYVYLTAGIEYEVHGSNLYTTKNINKGNIVTPFSDSTYTPESNIYLVKENGTFYVTYTTGNPDDEPSNNDPGEGDVSGGDLSNNEPDNPSGDNFDDTALLEVLHDIQMQLRCILFVCIWKFILPLVMKIRDHVFGLKHE